VQPSIRVYDHTRGRGVDGLPSIQVCIPLSKRHAAHPPDFLRAPLSAGSRAARVLIRRRHGGELERAAGLGLHVADGAGMR